MSTCWANTACSGDWSRFYTLDYIGPWLSLSVTRAIISTISRSFQGSFLFCFLGVSMVHHVVYIEVPFSSVSSSSDNIFDVMPQLFKRNLIFRGVAGNCVALQRHKAAAGAGCTV